MTAIRKDFTDVTERDIAFLILCDEIEDKGLCFNLAYGINSPNVSSHYTSEKINRLRELLEPYGIGTNNNSITKDENMASMLRLLQKIKQQFNEGLIDAKDALKMESDIRVKLQDKFNMGDGKEQKRIIVVPQKHDLICPHSQRECTYMPSKEACMAYYKLIDDNNNE